MSRIQLASLTVCSVFAFGMLHVVPTQAAIKTQVVEYKQGDATLEGFLVYDDAIAGKRPGILVVHEWDGLGDYAKMRAEMLAKLGYVAFAADIYGKGVRPTTMQAMAEQSSKFGKDRPLTRARITAALDQLRGNAMVDTSKLGAIGYCFGGMVALELVRSGADIRGVAVFHAALGNPNPADAKNIKASVLVLHGVDDPLVNSDAVAAFEKEMRETKVDWQLVAYGGTVHSFTNPKANLPDKGIAYNASSDKRSWAAMEGFFKEIFDKK